MFNWENLYANLGILILVVWEGFWKGIALWKCSKRGDLRWFIAIFIINLFGILPIFYLWRTKQLQSVLNDIRSRFQKR